MYKLYLAIRYLLSRPIHLIGTIGITVAVWALIVVFSIFSGYLDVMVSHVRNAVADMSFLFNETKDSWSVAGRIVRETEGVKGAAPRVVWYGLVAPEKRVEREPGTLDPASTSGKLPTNFFQIVGIDPALESELRDVRSEFYAVEQKDKRVADVARPFQDSPDFEGEAATLPRLALGYARAEAWQLSRGDIVTLSSARDANTDSGTDVDQLSTVHKRFVFAGAFRSKFYEFENTTVLVDIDTMRRLFPIDGAKASDSFSEIAIMLDAPEDADRLERELETRLQKAGIVGNVAQWRARGFSSFLDNVEHQRSLMTYVLSILMAVSAFLVFATLLMMVSEKIKDVGILQSLGATRGGILMIFLISGSVIALAGASTGTALGVLTCVKIDAINAWLEASFGLSLFPRNIYGLDHVPYTLSPLWISAVAIVAVLTTLIFSLIAAWLAARMDPVKALRR